MNEKQSYELQQQIYINSNEVVQTKRDLKNKCYEFQKQIHIDSNEKNSTTYLEEKEEVVV
ncbi:742_t:CDS:1, partial [Gigaspora margarita]